jgi:hypothetical protein
MWKIFLALSLAFILFSCDSGNMNSGNTDNTENTGNETGNPFVGTWEDRDDYVIEQFIFSVDNKVTRTVQALSPEIENETNIGSYDYDEFIIYFRYQMPNDAIAAVRAEYSINDNKLTMTFLNTYKTYTYTKIK